MKSIILALAIILSFTGLASAQTQVPNKADTTITPKWGFSQQNYWTLPLKDSLKIIDFYFHTPKNEDLSLAKPFSNMPIMVPNGKHTMPVHTPDTSITYKLRIFNME